MSILFALSLTEEQYMLIKKLLLPIGSNEKPVVISNSRPIFKLLKTLTI